MLKCLLQHILNPWLPDTSWVQLLAVKPHVRRNANLNKFSISLKGIYTKMNEVIITSIWEAWVQNSVKAWTFSCFSSAKMASLLVYHPQLKMQFVSFQTDFCHLLRVAVGVHCGMFYCKCTRGNLRHAWFCRCLRGICSASFGLNFFLFSI